MSTQNTPPTQPVTDTTAKHRQNLSASPWPSWACSSLFAPHFHVGGERNELTRSMIEQTQAHSDAGYSTIRYRLVMLDLEKQRAILQTSGQAAKENPAIRRFLSLYTDYDKERKLSKDWAGQLRPSR